VISEGVTGNYEVRPRAGLREHTFPYSAANRFQMVTEKPVWRVGVSGAPLLSLEGDVLGMALFRENIVVSFDKGKLFGVPVVWRGGGSHTVLPALFASLDDEEYRQRRHAPTFDDTRDIARLLVKQSGCLEGLLMLEDLGSVADYQLIEESVESESLLEVITALVVHGLANIDRRKVWITAKGREVVEKLRRPSP
jgi:hypothetical protein